MPFDPDMIRHSPRTGVSVAGKAHSLYQSSLPQGDCEVPDTGYADKAAVCPELSETATVLSGDGKVASAPLLAGTSGAEHLPAADAEAQPAAVSAAAATSRTELPHPEAGVPHHADVHQICFPADICKQGL